MTNIKLSVVALSSALLKVDLTLLKNLPENLSDDNDNNLPFFFAAQAASSFFFL